MKKTLRRQLLFTLSYTDVNAQQKKWAQIGDSILLLWAENIDSKTHSPENQQLQIYYGSKNLDANKVKGTKYVWNTIPDFGTVNQFVNQQFVILANEHLKSVQDFRKHLKAYWTGYTTPAAC